MPYPDAHPAMARLPVQLALNAHVMNITALVARRPQ
jgi:hypothetical protein